MSDATDRNAVQKKAERIDEAFRDGLSDASELLHDVDQITPASGMGLGWFWLIEPGERPLWDLQLALGLELTGQALGELSIGAKRTTESWWRWGVFLPIFPGDEDQARDVGQTIRDCLREAAGLSREQVTERLEKMDSTFITEYPQVTPPDTAITPAQMARVKKIMPLRSNEHHPMVPTMMDVLESAPSHLPPEELMEALGQALIDEEEYPELETPDASPLDRDIISRLEAAHRALGLGEPGHFTRDVSSRWHARRIEGRIKSLHAHIQAVECLMDEMARIEYVPANPTAVKWILRVPADGMDISHGFHGSFVREEGEGHPHFPTAIEIIHHHGKVTVVVEHGERWEAWQGAFPSMIGMTWEESECPVLVDDLSRFQDGWDAGISAMNEGLTRIDLNEWSRLRRRVDRHNEARS